MDADGAADAWHTFPGDNKFKTSKDVREKVHWIINNSYPQVPVAHVAKAAPDLAGLTEREAITATQAAIWHFTDDLVVTDFAARIPAGQRFRKMS
ncbi:hypothetical protein BSZ39_00250 [Bowdeniella nasicola]|uniref:Thioester domain-containing protein n=2 Tax=Bowdeniella nasicola TaxID=208480 RepID=A0A1Q5Q5V4_9ACTO|nr:hypothetical protein BSZ39_00250 [Bowdeniella nasicola]